MPQVPKDILSMTLAGIVQPMQQRKAQQLQLLALLTGMERHEERMGLEREKLGATKEAAATEKAEATAQRDGAFMQQVIDDVNTIATSGVKPTAAYLGTTRKKIVAGAEAGRVSEEGTAKGLAFFDKRYPIGPGTPIFTPEEEETMTGAEKQKKIADMLDTGEISPETAHRGQEEEYEKLQPKKEPQQRPLEGSEGVNIGNFMNLLLSGTLGTFGPEAERTRGQGRIWDVEEWLRDLIIPHYKKETPREAPMEGIDSEFPGPIGQEMPRYRGGGQERELPRGPMRGQGIIDWYKLFDQPGRLRTDLLPLSR